MSRPLLHPSAEGSAPVTGEPSARLPGSGVSWLPVCAVVAVALAWALPAAAFSGATAPLLLADAGPWVRWGQVVIGVVHDVAAALSVGLLVVGGFLVPEGRTSRRREVAATGAALAASVWAAAALASLLVGFAEVANLPLGGAGYWSTLSENLLALELVRLWTIEVALATILAVVCAAVRTRGGLAWAAVLAFATLVPVAYTGHSSGLEGHETAVTALGIHLIAVTSWVGGLLALIVLRPHLGPALLPTTRRFSTLALWCYVAVGLSGLLFALDAVQAWDDLLTAYWALVWGKILLLVVLGASGYAHRRWLLGRGLRDGAAFFRLATVEALVMAAALGLAVALSRTPPTGAQEIDSTSSVQLLTGYPEPPVLTPGSWLTVWQVNWFFLLIAVMAVGLYLAGVRRLRRRGDGWPLLATVAWIVGWAVFVYTTQGAPGVYGRVLFSMHMVMHMALMMVIPIFLVLGSAITLALRALAPRRDKTLGPREVLLAVVHSRYAAVVANPVVAAAIFFGSLVGFYWSGALELALTTHIGHVLMTLHFLLAGYAFVWSLIGTDPGPAKWPAPMRLLVLLATLAAHAFFGLALMSGTWLLAPGFFKALELSWDPDLLVDQQLGGTIAWGIGEMPTLVLAMLVTWDWLRRDERDARRGDRRAARDEDAELAAYNERLASMNRPRS